MTPTDVVNVVAATILSIGGGGAIVFGLSAWLGKVWANRLMESERARYATDLEQLRAQLQHTNSTRLTELRNDLDIYKEKHLKGHLDKMAIYRLAADVIVDFLGDFDQILISGTVPPDIKTRLDRFNRGRMKAYAYLAMLAPQTVMDAYDALIDHLFEIIEQSKKYEWREIRKLALNILNEIRKDIGGDVSPIEYRGKR